MLETVRGIWRDHKNLELRLSMQLFLLLSVLFKTDNIFNPYYEYHLDLCSELCLSSRLAILHSKNCNAARYMQTVRRKFFIPAMPIGTIDLLPFYTAFTDLDLAWG